MREKAGGVHGQCDTSDDGALMGYVVVMFDAGEWHGVWAGPTWFEATRAHAGAIGALRELDHPHAEDVKIIPTGADYAHPPHSEEMR